jgi:hypothetical protein
MVTLTLTRKTTATPWGFSLAGTVHSVQQSKLYFYLENSVKTSVADLDPDPVGSGPFWSDPDPDPDVWDRIRILIRILALIYDPKSTFFGVCKSHKYCCLTFCLMNILFRAYFGPKKSRRKLSKISLGQDPDPDVFKSRIRIRSKIVRIRNTGKNYIFTKDHFYPILL